MGCSLDRSTRESTSRLSSPNRDKREWNRDIPRALLPVTRNCFLKMMENTQAWKESVITNSAS